MEIRKLQKNIYKNICIFKDENSHPYMFLVI